MPTAPTIRSATPADLPQVGKALANAFADDPIWTWLTSHDEQRYHRGAPGFFEADARSILSGPGQVLVDENLGGAALWCAPDHWRSTVGQTLRIAPPAFRLLGARLPRALASLTAMEREHPKDPPHWYLSILGTDPSHQGRGVGSALIHAVTDRCDEEGVPAYLESSKESNIAFYARHGFEVTSEHRFAKGGPMLWLMWRDPR